MLTERCLIVDVCQVLQKDRAVDGTLFVVVADRGEIDAHARVSKVVPCRDIGTAARD